MIEGSQVGYESTEMYFGYRLRVMGFCSHLAYINLMSGYQDSQWLFFLCLFIYFERDRDRVSGGGTERGKGRILSTASAEPDASNSQNHEIMTWVETRSRMLDWLSPPGAPVTIMLIILFHFRKHRNLECPPISMVKNYGACIHLKWCHFILNDKWCLKKTWTGELFCVKLYVSSRKENLKRCSWNIIRGPFQMVGFHRTHWLL